jgi:hypothetical protein
VMPDIADLQWDVRSARNSKLDIRGRREPRIEEGENYGVVCSVVLGITSPILGKITDKTVTALGSIDEVIRDRTTCRSFQDCSPLAISSCLLEAVLANSLNELAFDSRSN